MLKVLFIGLLGVAPGNGDAQAGKRIFSQHCVVCHGVTGKGDGPGAAGLNPKPANFSDPERHRGMTLEMRLSVVTLGGPSEKLSPAMPAFGEVLTAQQIKDVLAYVQSFAPKQPPPM